MVWRSLCRVRRRSADRSSPSRCSWSRLRACSPAQAHLRTYAPAWVARTTTARGCPSLTNSSTLSIKVRQQLRTQGASRTHLPVPTRADIAPRSTGAHAESFWAVGLEMARTECVQSLAGGASASVLREIVYSGIRMGTYEYFKDK